MLGGRGPDNSRFNLNSESLSPPSSQTSNALDEAAFLDYTTEPLSEQEREVLQEVDAYCDIVRNSIGIDPRHWQAFNLRLSQIATEALAQSNETYQSIADALNDDAEDPHFEISALAVAELLSTNTKSAPIGTFFLDIAEILQIPEEEIFTHGVDLEMNVQKWALHAALCDTQPHSLARYLDIKDPRELSAHLSQYILYRINELKHVEGFNRERLIQEWQLGEESKFGFSYEELLHAAASDDFSELVHSARSNGVHPEIGLRHIYEECLNLNPDNIIAPKASYSEAELREVMLRISRNDELLAEKVQDAQGYDDDLSELDEAYEELGLEQQYDGTALDAEIYDISLDNDAIHEEVEQMHREIGESFPQPDEMVAQGITQSEYNCLIYELSLCLAEQLPRFLTEEVYKLSQTEL